MNRNTLDPYATLGVPRDASQRQVQEAYRRLARRYHPDLRSDAEATRRMQRVNQAREILLSPTRRARYDATSPSRAADGGHWAASRRTAPMGAGPTVGYGTWASPSPPAGPYGTRATRAEDKGDGPGFLGVVLSGALVLVAFVALFTGILPFPLAGLVLLVLVRGVFDRFDGGAG
jgi:curved DNA-binding protein